MSEPRRRVTHSLYANEGGGVRTWQEVLPSDPPDQDELIAAVNALLDRADKAASSIVLAQELKRLSKAIGR